MASTWLVGLSPAFAGECFFSPTWLRPPHENMVMRMMHRQCWPCDCTGLDAITRVCMAGEGFARLSVAMVLAWHEREKLWCTLTRIV